MLASALFLSNSTPKYNPQLVTAVKLASPEKTPNKALFNRTETSKRIDLVNKKRVPEKTYEKVATITKKPIKNGLSPNKTNPDNKPRSNKLNTKGNVASLSQSTSEEDEEIYSTGDIKSSGRKKPVRTEKGERTEMPLYSNEKIKDTEKMFLSHLDEDIATLSEKLFNQRLDLGVTDLCAFNSSELLIHTLVGNTKEFPVEANLQSAVKEFAIENRQEEEMKMILHEHESKKEKKKDPFSPDLYNNTYNLYNDLLLMTPLCNKKTAPYAFRPNKLKTNGNLVSLIQSTYEEDYLRAKISRRKNAVITENGKRNMKTLYSKEKLEDINKMILSQVDEDIAKFSENLVNPWLELCVTKTDYTFRSFVKLSKLRSSSELQSNDHVNSLLMDLITSAGQVNPEFTFFQENVRIGTRTKETYTHTHMIGHDLMITFVFVGGKSSYRLISFISHIGRTQFSGHYVADCFTKSSNLWMSCNDEIITLVNKTDLLELGLSSAYVLLYERVGTDGNPT
ncbi:hypothetical protein C0J50_4989 [Silurus asotus]|uniref:Peptidase C19 ubiquitin carboxyl-terminal hydrolase domain-containing protein n=1 Tax=Silurus asotus TaxID=30991 RepID=A0AAD5FCY9_SILAS|nr:hypothetical protein C0J50_4989 [Silurus asotus]